MPAVLDDPLPLAQALIRCPSVTPDDAGALDVLQQALAGLGFACRRMRFSAEGTPDVDNLFAILGDAGPHFCFAGHTDVVPVGDRAAWRRDPFGAVVEDGILHGRGAVDMKSAIACFVTAVARHLERRGGPRQGRISLLITGDEEGPAINGTVRMLQALAEDGLVPDACLVGEPTNPAVLGDMVKIGRRGSMNGVLTVTGVQGHVGYPHLADNPLPRLCRMALAIGDPELDAGTAHFQKSNLEITSIDTGNPATNVIPASGTARFNIRFNTEWTPASLEAWLRARLDATGGAYDLAVTCGAEPFLTAPGGFTRMIADAVAAATGRQPELSTTGGTSDARFISRYCPVAEFGLVGQTMHKVDEQVPVAALGDLTEIYAGILQRFFAGDGGPDAMPPGAT
ncbi:MAG: succinyl-diaminopimelate desuccinylase [Sneathiellaceae bacterium]